MGRSRRRPGTSLLKISKTPLIRHALKVTHRARTIETTSLPNQQSKRASYVYHWSCRNAGRTRFTVISTDRSGKRLKATRTTRIPTCADVEKKVRNEQRQAAKERAKERAVHDCSSNRPLGQTGAWYGDMSVRNLSCYRGQRALRGAWFSQGGVRVRGWSCYQLGTYGDGGIFRCVRGSSAMRFAAGG